MYILKEIKLNQVLNLPTMPNNFDLKGSFYYTSICVSFSCRNFIFSVFELFISVVVVVPSATNWKINLIEIKFNNRQWDRPFIT